MFGLDHNEQNESNELGQYIYGSQESKYDQRARPHSQLAIEELLLRINNINIKLEPICDERFGNLTRSDLGEA